MKRLSLLLLAIALSFATACQPDENKNKNSNANANGNNNGNANRSVAPPTSLTDKVVEIYIYDDLTKPGYYVIDDPGSVILHKTKNQKITWCIIYDGSTTPDEVVIDNFRSPPPPATPTATNPFGAGTPDDNTFKIAAADFGCKKGTKTPKATADLGKYKYLITVKFGGADKGHLDPQVVIDN